MTSGAWRETELGSVATFQRGFDITKKQQRPGPFPVISSSGPKSTHDEYRVNGPGVVIGRKGLLGGVYFEPGNFWPHDTTLWVKDFHGNDPRFVYYFLKTLHLEAYDVGAANPTLNRNHIHPLPVVAPDLRTQRTIAAVLSAYDDLIENNRRRIRILQEMAGALYREWFVEFRFPGHEESTVVESELGLIPEGWRVLPMDAVCGRITDGAHKSPASVDDGLPMASVKNMHDWGLHIEDCRRISPTDFDELARNHCRPLAGDVLIAKDGSYLKHVFAVEEDMDVVLLSSIAILRPNDVIEPHYLVQYLKDDHVRARLRGYVSGVAIQRIVLKDFRHFLIVVPDEGTLRRWSKTAERSTQLCWRLIDRNRVLTRTRDLLLPRLISGKFPVEDLDIQLPPSMQEEITEPEPAHA